MFDALALKEGTLAAGTTAQYYRGDKSWQTLDSSIVTENTNLYHTSARADARIAAASISDLSNVHTAAATDGQVLKWDNGNSRWAPASHSTIIGANDVNDLHIDWGTGTNQVSTADIPESTNLFYTDARADARITNAGSANWNTAFGWGNHASGGYLTSVGVLSSHTDVHNAAATDGQVLTWVNANSRWEPAAGSGGIALTDLSVGSEGSASGDGSIAYNNSTGVFTYTPPTASGIGAGTMSNVVEDTSPQLGGDLDAQTNEITNVGKLQLVDGLDDSVLEIDVGYARQSTWALTGSTSGTTPAEIFVGGTASRRVLPADYNDVAMFEISVVAVDTNTLANSAAWKFTGFGFNNAGTLALIGNITEEEINAQTGWSVVIGVTSTDLTITVTADAGSAVKWAAFAKCTQAQSS